jgi:anthranilate phosphoribosyltransferase
MQTSELSGVQVKDGVESRDMLVAALSNKAGPARDIVAINSGAAIYVAGIADSLETGVIRALEVISSGAAKAKLDQFVAYTQKMKG